MCTCFVVYGKEKTIYGMNFDTEDIDLKLKIHSNHDKNIFYFSGLMDDIYRDIAGISSDGLFMCTQAVEYSQDFEPHSSGDDWFAFDALDEALNKAKNASDFMVALNNRMIIFPINPLFPKLGLHTIIADKYGEAFILEDGTDGNTTSKIKNDFMIMTNFPNGDFKGTHYEKVWGCGADRYISAHEYIESNIHCFGKEEAFEALKRTSQDNTLCSIVFEPLHNKAYIRFKMDFDKKWEVSISDKTIRSLDGLLSNNEIPFINGEIFVKDLLRLY